MCTQLTRELRNRQSKKWTEMKTETDKSVYIAEDFNEHSSLRHRTSRKISNSTEEMNQVH